MNKKILSVVGLSLAVLAGLTCVDKALHAQDASGEPKQLVEAYELMSLFFGPLQEQMKAGLATPPADRKAWRNIFDTALKIGEVHNLLYSRTGEDYMGTEDWKKLTAAGRDTAAAIAEAVKTQDFPKVQAGYTAMIESCNACHKKFQGDEPEIVEP